MSKYIIVRLMSYPKESIEWVVEDENKKLIIGSQQGHDIQEYQSEIKDSRVFVLVPGHDIFLTEIKLPHLSQSQLIKAIPYALEDKLADNIKNLHFSIGQPEINNLIPVAITSKVNMESWRLRLDYFFQSPNLIIESLLPDTLTLPWKPNEWTIFIDNDMALVRTNLQAGFSLEEKSLWTIITMLLKHNDTHCPVRIEMFSDTAVPAQIMNLFKNLHITIHQNHKINLLHCIGATTHTSSPINLLKGLYESNTQTQKKRFFYYNMIIFPIILLLIYTIGSLFQIYILEHQKHIIDDKITSHFLQIFPNKKMTNNKIKEYIQNELNTINTNYNGNYFLRILKITSPLLSQSPGITILGLEYTDKQLTLELEANDFVLLDNLTHALNKNNLKAQQIDAKTIGNKVQASISIEDIPQ
jgi:general secretion pathway protein L